MAISNSLTKSKRNTSLAAYLTQEAVKNQISNIVGGRSQRFISAIVSAVNTNPQLQECTNQSIVSGALLGESLNLSPSPQLGQYYLVPFNDKNKGKVAQFQLGYKGYIQLAIRSGQYKKLNVLAIKKGELVKFDPLNEEIEVNLMQNEEERENAETVGYYAMFEYTNGFRKAIYWSKAKMEAHAMRYSMGYRAKKGYTFWEKDFDAMAYKTMLRQLISKWGIMSVDMVNAFENDMAVLNEDGSKFYIDTDETKEVVEVTEEPITEEQTEETDPAKALFGE